MPKLNRLLILLLILHILKGIVTTIIVPLWEFPDEQAHFAQISYYVERHSTTFPPSSDLSLEIYESERVLHTIRDNRGDNYFVYHPERRHDFSSGLTGPEETYLKNLPLSSRTQYVKREAPRTPPLFYHLSSLGYRLTYFSNLFIRVFATRFVSILLSTATIYIAYSIGQLILSDQPLFAFTLATVTSFHPMFSFVSSGINNDNLINLLGALLLYFCLRLLRSGPTLPLLLAAGAVIGLGVITKPLIFPLLPGFALALIIEWRQSKRSLFRQLRQLIPLITVSIVAGGWIFIKPIIQTGYIPHLPRQSSTSPPNPIGLIDYTVSNLKLHYRQTLVWYWGVFKWLGVVLPLNLIRTIKTVMLVSFIGIAQLLFSRRQPLIRTITAFLILYSLFYFITLSAWDFLLVRSLGFSHGLQGRHFFPTVIAHLSLMTIGVYSLSSCFKHLLLKLFSLFIIFTHAASWFTLSKSYYSLASLTTFLNQISQYKPWFLKQPGLLLWFSLYLIIFIFYLHHYISFKSKST